MNFSTLEYLINVGVRLLIFWQISSHYVLIPYPTFIDFIKKVHPVSLFYILLNWNIQIFAIFQHLASKKCWFFIILKEVLTHFIKFYTLEGNIPSPTINIFGKFPPNTFIPHPTFILLRVNVHPIWLFHTLPLLGTQEYSMLFTKLWAIKQNSRMSISDPFRILRPWVQTSINTTNIWFMCAI